MITLHTYKSLHSFPKAILLELLAGMFELDCSQQLATSLQLKLAKYVIAHRTPTLIEPVIPLPFVFGRLERNTPSTMDQIDFSQPSLWSM